MTQSHRLPAPRGALLRRERTLSFTFDGRRYEGFDGDSIASALAANGVSLLSRSFKYHRPRGILTLAGHDANALVQLPDEPNAPADCTPLADGMRVEGQNYHGSLANDRGMLVQHFARFLPVGFYYKAFYRPHGIWQRFWEPFFRQRAGLGRVNVDAAERYYDKRYEFCDVAVIGGGAAGLCAAAAAADAGADVLLVDENPLLGGALNYARVDADGAAAAVRRRELVERVERLGGRVRVFANAVCNGWFADHYLPVLRGDRLHKVRAGKVIVAAGAIEQPLVFHNNDLPGVMQGSAAQRLIHLYGVKPGERAVVVTANSDGYGVCLDLLDAGVQVAAVADMRESPPQCALAQAVAARHVKVWRGHVVYEASGGAGLRRVAAAGIRPISGRGECAAGGDTVECDLICMSPGYMPAWQLPCQAGAALRYDDARNRFSLDHLPDGFAVAGGANGCVTFDAACHDGHAAAARVVDGVSAPPALADAPADAVQSGSAAWHIFPHPKGKEFVDFDEDLQVADILNAAADGYDHVQLAKRYSTAGMGPSQGRHAALAVARLLAQATGKSVGEVGVTTARPPVTGEKLGALGGRQFSPLRRTALHGRHRALGAQFMPAGLWHRPAFYGAAAERRECIEREAMAVREATGMVDISTLGGLEVSGAEAGAFLNRVYTGRFDTLKVGRTRYAVMCNEQGVVIDDGVACRLHERQFYVTATTAGVDTVYRQLLKWNAQWRMDVDISNVSAAWAAVNVAGARSRELLAAAGCDLDLSAEGFAYMAVKCGRVAGLPARVLRVGFVGELGFEIHVPATMGGALWDALAAAGAGYGLRPFGVEAQRLLRLEKGHIIIGQDTDSLAFPHEAGLQWALADKAFFVGQRGAAIAARDDVAARRLVGFTLPAEAACPKESHLVITDGEMTGRVTSCAYSPALKKIIGLAYVGAAQSAVGGRLGIRTDGGVMVTAEVAALPFYDPERQRQ